MNKPPKHPGSKRGYAPEPEDVFIEKLAQQYLQQLGQFLAKLREVNPQIAQALWKANARGDAADRAKLHADFTRSASIAAAIASLPVEQITTADFGKLRAVELHELRDVSPGRFRSRFGDDWITVQIVESGYCMLYRPALSDAPSAMN